MRELKVLQIRDRGTNIAAIAIKPYPNGLRESRIFRHAGYGDPESYVILTSLEGHGSTYDPFAWDNSSRTFAEAHRALIANWDEYESGGVVCVEHYLGERDTPKVFE